MKNNYGSQSMVAPLKRVMVRRPDEAFGKAEPTLWHYASQPDLAKAQQEHDALAKMLTEFGSEVIYHQEPLPDHADAIFTHDPVLVCEGKVLASTFHTELDNDTALLEYFLTEF